MHKKFKAFTLIELLVVIAIVGILSGFIFVSMSSAVNSAKDARRQADLASIQHAILAYMAENNNAFPESSASCTMGSGGTCSNLSTNLTPYLKTIPLDPNGTNYTYTYSSSTSSFTIQGTLSNGNTYYYDSSSGQWSQASSPFVGWLYKKTITLSSTLTQDYQIKLTIPYGSGGCESHCKSDFSDLRFASTSGTTLNYWIESYTASTTATVWVKALNTSSSFVMYYGKSDATTTASGDNTFEFFDDFLGSSVDAAKWTATAGTPSVATSIATMVPTSGQNTWITSVNQSFGAGYAIRSYAKFSGGYCYNLFAKTDNSKNSGLQITQLTLNTGIYTFGMGGSNAFGLATTSTAYHLWDVKRLPASIAVACDGASIGSISITDTSNMGVSILAERDAAPNSGAAYVDWILVRKYTSSEPTSSFGTEQNN